MKRYCKNCGALMYQYDRGPLRYDQGTGNPWGYTVTYRCPNRTFWQTYWYSRHLDVTDFKILKTYGEGAKS